MFKQTYSDEAVKLARRIKAATQSELEGLYRDDLDDLASDFFFSLEGTPLLDSSSLVAACNGGFNKSETGTVLRRAAEDLLETHVQEQEERHEFRRRNGFYVETLHALDEAREEVAAACQQLAEDDWHWGSKVNRVVEAKARVNVLYDLIHHMEAYMWNGLGPGAAAEHALFKLREDLIYDTAKSSSSRSTSRGTNWEEDAVRAAKAELVNSKWNRYTVIQPVDHGAELEALKEEN